MPKKKQRKRRWGWEVWPGLPKNKHLGGWRKYGEVEVGRRSHIRAGVGVCPFRGCSWHWNLSHSYSEFLLCTATGTCTRSISPLIRWSRPAIMRPTAAGPAQIIRSAGLGPTHLFLDGQGKVSRGHVGTDPDGDILVMEVTDILFPTTRIQKRMRTLYPPYAYWRGGLGSKYT